MRPRLAAGCLLGIAAVAIAGPTSWLPWAAWVRHLLPQDWWLLPAIASVLLLAAAACLPGGAREAGPDACRPPLWPTQHRAEAVALGLGLLLLLEPLLHLAVLAYVAHASPPGAEDVLLPGAVGAAPSTLALRIGILCVLVPVAEEIFFRGRLLPWLARYLGPWPALSFTSLAFAAAHGSPIICLVAAPIGVLLGWLRLRHRDLGACVIVHQAHNGLFILAGPALVTAPLSVAVLAIGGALMLTLAALHSRLGWRALPAGLALAAVLACAVPGLLSLKDRWWGNGVARLALRSDADPDRLIMRLDLQARRGRLTQARAMELRGPLSNGTSSAARATRLWLDGANARSISPEQAYDDLLAAAQVSNPPPRLAAAASAICMQWPEVLIALAHQDPELVAGWLGPKGAFHAIESMHGRERKLLLSALERAWPGRLASVLLALPADEVTPLDRRHLRQNYDDIDDLIRALDPERQEAWRQ